MENKIDYHEELWEVILSIISAPRERGIESTEREFLARRIVYEVIDNCRLTIPIKEICFYASTRFEGEKLQMDLKNAIKNLL